MSSFAQRTPKGKIIVGEIMSGDSFTFEQLVDPKYNVVFSHDFEGNAIGHYQRDRWIKDWNPVPKWRDSENARDEEIQIIVDQNTDSHVLEVTYPKGSVGTFDTWSCDKEPVYTYGGGEYWTSYFTDEGGYDELYFSYNVMFKPGFNFVLGGKLPFLAGGPRDKQGATKPTAVDGFDCILLFNTSSEDDRSTGRMRFYIYHQNVPNERYAEAREWKKDGEAFKFDVSDSIWYNITTRIKVNTWTNGVANKDGFIEGFIDGEFIMGMYNLELLTGYNEGKGIDRMGIASFFGGCATKHSAARDEWAYFDDFLLFTYDESVDVPRGSTWSDKDRVLLLPNLKEEKKNEVYEDTIAPTIPYSLHETSVTDSSISFTWNTSSDNVGVTGYNVFLNAKRHASTPNNQLTISGLNPNTLYSIAVTAYDSSGNESDHSDLISISTKSNDSIPPSRPEGLTAVSATASKVTVIWENSVDNMAVKGYNIFVDSSHLGTSTYNNFLLEELDPDREYLISISAFDAAGNVSEMSESLLIKTAPIDLEAPSVPQELRTSLVTINSIAIIWEKSLDNFSVKGYHIFERGTRIGTTLSNAFLMSDLDMGDKYVISVSAFDHAGNESDRSNVILVETLSPTDTFSQRLPELLIIDVANESEASAQTTAKINSFGFAELMEFGLTVQKSTESNNYNHFFVTGFIDFNPGTIYSNESAEVISSHRIEENLQVLYNFTEEKGNLVMDKSGSGDAVNLQIEDIEAVTWLPGQGLKVDDTTRISSMQSTKRIIDSIAASKEITIEVWVRSSEINQSGPAPILSISKEDTAHIAVIGQKGTKDYYNYVAGFNAVSSNNGMPELISEGVFINLNLHHIIYQKNASGEEKVFINGVEQYSGSNKDEFSLSGSDFFLNLSNLHSEDQPWFGTYYLAAIYNRALNQEEILQNYTAGIGEIRYTSVLDVEPNVYYSLTPYALTKQGMVYGATEKVIFSNFLADTNSDSIFINVYPNPSNGDFRVKFKTLIDNTLQSAFLRIADINGQLLYTDEIYIGDAFISRLEHDIELSLSTRLNEGIYLLTLIIGDNSVTSRVIIQ